MGNQRGLKRHECGSSRWSVWGWLDQTEGVFTAVGVREGHYGWGEVPNVFCLLKMPGPPT